MLARNCWTGSWPARAEPPSASTNTRRSGDLVRSDRIQLVVPELLAWLGRLDPAMDRPDPEFPLSLVNGQRRKPQRQPDPAPAGLAQDRSRRRTVGHAGRPRGDRGRPPALGRRDVQDRPHRGARRGREGLAARAGSAAARLRHVGPGRARQPVPLENRIRLVTCRSSARQAARAYSLISPSRTGFRRIRSLSRAVMVARGASGSSSGTRWDMPWCGRAVL